MEANAAGVVHSCWDRVPRHTTLRVSVVVVVAEVAEPVIGPAANRVDEARGIELADDLGELLLGPRRVPELAPAFVEDDLDRSVSSLVALAEM